MASAAQHKLTVQLTAQVDAAYKSALEQARTAVADLKAQIDTLRDSANSVKEYQDLQNELETLTAKLLALQTQYTDTQTKMQGVTGSTKTWESALATLQKKINTVKVEIAEKRTQLEQLATKLNTAGVSTDNLSASEQQLRAEYDRLSSELKTAEAALEQLESQKKQAIANAEAEAEATAKSQKALEEHTEATEDAGDSTETFGSKLEKIAEGALYSFGYSLEQWVINKLSQIPELFEECIDAAIEFESAITGVAKTTDFSSEELEAYADAIQELATVIPESTTDLAAVSETAGQLGIASEDMLSFTEVMAMLGTATNMTSDTAATYLAQMANITQMDPDYYENLASAIVYLGNNYATTEEKIVKMSQRTAAAASIAGMTEAEIVGISAAVGSLGVEAMVGGTTITSVITDITTAVGTASEDIETYAWAAGMSADEFVEAWEDDAASTFAAVVTGLADTERLGVKSTTEALQQIGITEDRATRVMLSLAESGDLLTNAIVDANEAWEENTALVTEAELRYETTESKIQIFKNAVEVLAQSIGEKFTPTLGELAEWATGIITSFTSLIDGSDLLQDEFDDLTDTMDTETQTLALIDTYRELSAALEDTSLSTEERAALETSLAEAGEALIEVMPDYVEAIYSENTALAEQLDLIESLVEGNNELTRTETLENLKEQGEEAAEAYQAELDAAEQLAELQTVLGNVTEIVTEYGTDENGAAALLEYMTDAYATFRQELSEGVTAGVIDISGETVESTQAMEDYIASFLSEMELYAQALTGAEKTFTTSSVFASWLSVHQNGWSWMDTGKLGTDTLTAGLAGLRDQRDALEETVSSSEELYQSYAQNMAIAVNSGAVTEEWAEQQIAANFATETAEEVTLLYSDALYELQAAAEDAGDELEDYTDDTVSSADAMEMLDGAAADLAQAVAEGRISYDAAASSILTMGENLGQGEYAADAFNSAMDDAIAIMYEADSAADWASDEIDSLTESMQDLVDEWEDYYDTAASAVGLFDDMTPEEPDEDEEVTTAKDLLTALESQVTYYETYLENIEKLRSMGLNEGILEELLSGTSSDSEYLSILAEASQETVDQINAAWEESEEAKDTFAETLADMQLDMDEAMQNLLETSEDTIEQMNLSAEAADAAYETMQAYIEELEAGGSEAYTTALYYANLIANALGGNTITYTVTTETTTGTVSAESNVTENGEILEGYGYHAAGGIFSQEHLAWVAEDGPEAIIPLTDTARGLAIWEQAGRILGVPSTTSNSSYVSESYAPAINITVNGNAGSDTVLDIKRAVQQALKEQERTARRTRYA